MEESSTYRAIVQKGRELGLEQGRTEEARSILLLQGETRFGAPNAATRAAINTITDLAQLHELAVRVMSAASWQDLLSLPARPNGHRRTRRRGGT
jgi:hypothetical protein